MPNASEIMPQHTVATRIDLCGARQSLLELALLMMQRKRGRAHQATPGRNGCNRFLLLAGAAGMGTLTAGAAVPEGDWL